MRKFLLKILITAVVLSIAVMSAACYIFGISIQDAQNNLETAGYTVTITDGTTYCDSDENPFPSLSGAELEYYLYAVKGDDQICMYFFYFLENASSEYDFMHMDNLTKGLNNNVIYFEQVKQ